jgi:hypothetical protein
LWFGIVLWVVPILSLVLYFMWPQSLTLKVIANTSVLAWGMFWLSAIEELIVGVKQFTLPLLNFAIILGVGTILSVRMGWQSTALIIGGYAFISVASGIRRRFYR